MACPFFHPTARFADGAWIQPPRLPLGDPCRGECTATPGAPPGLDDLRANCNVGYTRDRCERFPRDPALPDAHRFSIESDQTDSIVVVYIEEKDYTPMRFGPLTYRIAGARFEPEPPSANLEAQARMFVASYLERRANP